MDTNEQTPPEQRMRRQRRGSIMWGFLILALGIIFLLQNYFPQININKFWPVILIIIGAGILYNGLQRN